jgi:hypothetical protein
MKILMVCAEFAPWAKTGGLADAVAGLSDALSASGHDVRVLMPRYSHLEAPRGTRHTVDGLGGPFRITEIEPEQKAEHAGKRRAGPRIFLLDLGELTGDFVYTGDARDAGRFLRLSSAAVALSATDGWRPDVLHCHDWHTALVPVFSAAPKSRSRSVLTLHNVGWATSPTRFEEHGFAALERRRRPTRAWAAPRTSARKTGGGSCHDREPDLRRGDSPARVRHGPRGRAERTRPRPRRHSERRRLPRVVARSRSVPAAPLRRDGPGPEAPP